MSSQSKPGLRGRWSDDRFTLEWMVVALVTGLMALLAPRLLLQPLWTPVHAVTLGVVSNGIFQWSWFFARGLLHFPLTPATRAATFSRIVVLNVGILLLFAAMWTAIVPLAIVATVLICAAGLHQAVVLTILARRYRTHRYAVIARSYAIAFYAFVLTCGLGGLLAFEMVSDAAPAWLVDHADGLAIAHSVLGIGGWVSLTILATIVTLGLSMLHARQDPHALSSAGLTLPVFVGSLGVAVVGALADLTWLVAAGTGIFVIGAVWGILIPLFRSFRVRKRASHTSWPVLIGLVWLVALIAAFAVIAAITPSMRDLREILIDNFGFFAAASVGQIFIGSFHYLVPVAIGGGPRVQRVGDVTVAFHWPVRFTLRNASLVLLLVIPTQAHVGNLTMSTALLTLVLICYGVDVALAAVAAITQIRTKRAYKASHGGKND